MRVWMRRMSRKLGRRRGMRRWGITSRSPSTTSPSQPKSHRPMSKPSLPPEVAKVHPTTVRGTIMSYHPPLGKASSSSRCHHLSAPEMEASEPRKAWWSTSKTWIWVCCRPSICKTCLRRKFTSLISTSRTLRTRLGEGVLVGTIVTIEWAALSSESARSTSVTWGKHSVTSRARPTQTTAKASPSAPIWRLKDRPSFQILPSSIKSVTTTWTWWQTYPQSWTTYSSTVGRIPPSSSNQTNRIHTIGFSPTATRCQLRPLRTRLSMKVRKLNKRKLPFTSKRWTARQILRFIKIAIKTWQLGKVEIMRMPERVCKTRLRMSII